MFCFNIDYDGLTRPQICTCHDNTVAVLCSITMTRHNGRDGVSNHQPHDCLLNKFRVTGLCRGDSPGTGEFPAQMASNAENVSIWWRHHVNSDATRSLLSHPGIPGWLYVFVPVRTPPPAPPPPPPAAASCPRDNFWTTSWISFIFGTIVGPDL